MLKLKRIVLDVTDAKLATDKHITIEYKPKEFRYHVVSIDNDYDSKEELGRLEGLVSKHEVENYIKSLILTYDSIKIFEFECEEG